MVETAPTEEGKWDHDKAEDLGHLLMERTEFPELLEHHQEEVKDLEDKHRRISEKAIERAAELTAEADITSLMRDLKLEAVVLKGLLGEKEVQIEEIVLHKKQTEEAEQVSDELLQDYARFYDTDPAKYGAMTTEEFFGHVDKIDAIKKVIKYLEEWQPKFNEINHAVDTFEQLVKDGEQPKVDWAWIDTFKVNYIHPILALSGADSDVETKLKQECQALVDASYDELSPKQLVLDFCELNRRWLQFIADAKAAKEAELEALLSS